MHEQVKRIRQTRLGSSTVHQAARSGAQASSLPALQPTDRESLCLLSQGICVVCGAQRTEFSTPARDGAGRSRGLSDQLATEKQVAPATHRQALNMLLFLHRQVLGIELPWMQQIGRPPERKRVPVVLKVQEVQTLLGELTGTAALLAALLFGSELRSREALGLRVKDVDFYRHAIIVATRARGRKRTTCIPRYTL